MEVPKVILSEPEQRLITDVGIILTKNNSIEKIVEFFSRLAGSYGEICLPLKAQRPNLFGIHPKISKGEKHLGLPWIMLDYPRCFNKAEGQLAIRTFFWWGNYFSIQLQVSGRNLPAFLRETPGWLRLNPDWFHGITKDAWDLDLPNANWVKIDDEQTAQNDDIDQVLKLAKKFPIDDWETIGEKFTNAYQSLFILMQSALRLQAGETVP